MRFSQTYDDLEDEAHANLQDEFADMWLFTPLAVKPNMTPQRDVARAEQFVYGVFSWLPKQVGMYLDEMQVSSRDPMLTLRRNCAPAEIKQKDRFTRRKGGLLFEVTDVRRDGLSGIEIDLVQLGRQS